jgi:hypothetical protein
MTGPCPKCPCPGICLRWAPFCAWAAADPPDATSLRHICARSGRPPDDAPPAAGGGATAGGRTAAEALALARAMKACQYRSTVGCGCSGARCALRAGRTVAHPDCFECLGRYG